MKSLIQPKQLNHNNFFAQNKFIVYQVLQSVAHILQKYFFQSLHTEQRTCAGFMVTLYIMDFYFQLVLCYSRVLFFSVSFYEGLFGKRKRLVYLKIFVHKKIHSQAMQ